LDANFSSARKKEIAGLINSSRDGGTSWYSLLFMALLMRDWMVLPWDDENRLNDAGIR
jgi:hypothetical protein